jgi:hypothetical protein
VKLGETYPEIVTRLLWEPRFSPWLITTGLFSDGADSQILKSAQVLGLAALQSLGEGEIYSHANFHESRLSRLPGSRDSGDQGRRMLIRSLILVFRSPDYARCRRSPDPVRRPPADAGDPSGWIQDHDLGIDERCLIFNEYPPTRSGQMPTAACPYNGSEAGPSNLVTAKLVRVATESEP